MKKNSKTILRVCLILISILPITAFAHYILFPQETRSLFIDYSDFKKDGHLYFSSSTPKSKIDRVNSFIAKATVRIDSFWGQKKSEPKFIYCDKENDFRKYAGHTTAPAVTYFKLGSVIVLSADALNLDIIAHEISHIEFYERIGFNKFDYKIPSWFKHGLAMQNDYRDYYSDDTLRARTNNFKNLPDINTLKSDEQFYAGTQEQIMLNYMTAKHTVKAWYTKEKLNQFILDMNAGKSFEEAYFVGR